MGKDPAKRKEAFSPVPGQTWPRGSSPGQGPGRLCSRSVWGWLLVGGRGWGGGSQVCPCPCWPGTLPSPDSLEVEVTVRASSGRGGSGGHQPTPCHPAPQPTWRGLQDLQLRPSCQARVAGKRLNPSEQGLWSPGAQAPGQGDWPAGQGVWEPLAGPGAADWGFSRESLGGLRAWGGVCVQRGW